MKHGRVRINITSPYKDNKDAKHPLQNSYNLKASVLLQRELYENHNLIDFMCQALTESKGNK